MQEIFAEVINMKLYDDNGHEVTNPAVLKILEGVKELVPDFKQEEPDYSDIVLYDDDGNRVTNRDTLEALREAREIAVEWRRRKGYPVSASRKEDG